MKFEIRDYRKVKKADIEVERITALGGKGGNGKSSTLGAVSSVMVGDPIPYQGFLKKNYKKLVNNESKHGYIEVTTDDVIAKITLPECKYTTGGARPSISKYSAGLLSLADLDSIGLTKYLTGVTGKVITKDAFYKELLIQGILSHKTEEEEQEIIKLWEDIEINGMDAMHAELKRQGAAKKANWEFITGEKYGKVKGKDWVPSGFSEEEFVGVDAMELGKEIEAQREWLAGAKAHTIITDSKKKELEEIANKEKSVLDKLEVIQAQIVTTKSELENARNAEVITAGLKCPECGKKLSMKNKKLIKSEPIHETYEHGGHGQIERLKKTLKELESRVIKGRAVLDNVVKAKNELKNVSTEGTTADVEKIQEKIRLLTSQKDAIIQYFGAKQIHNDIIKLSKLVKMLSPEGLRLSVLKPEIEKCNKFLAEMCNIIRLKEVKISDDLTITSDGMVYDRLLLSRSEQFIVNVLFQLLVAILELDDLVVIDDVDILTKEDRKRFIKMLLSPVFKEKKFLIAIAGDEKEKFLDFSKVVKGGLSYWIEDGRSEKL